MFLQDPFYEPANDWVIVWIGDLSASQLDDYLDEPGVQKNDEPISDFCRDLGRWYDHDFVWSEAVDEAISIHKLCQMNQVEPEKFINEIVQRSDAINAKCLLVLWNAKMVTRKERQFAKGQLRCIGNWKQKSPLNDPYQIETDDE